MRGGAAQETGNMYIYIYISPAMSVLPMPLPNPKKSVGNEIPKTIHYSADWPAQQESNL
jgi:hypothetical protein